jgi:phage tail-like protein
MADTRSLLTLAGSPRPSATPGRSVELATGAHYKVVVTDKIIGLFSKVTGLTAEYEVYEYQEGGQNGFRHRLRGPAKHGDLTLIRGITDNGALLDWFKRCQESVDRSDGHIELLLPNSVCVRKWAFEAAFPVKWEGPGLNAASGEAVTETLVLAHRGIREVPA